ncbi:septal ring lytic transglycosylase RlpA family protein [Bdellovibrio sp. HCB337]|uniref:septal ring lytic transglycosylase RlpA family protein n=1 Tax=Bdellovibrio sp. HCB337 TaxID=3394358 RepID=UPI0039A4629C
MRGLFLFSLALALTLGTGSVAEAKKSPARTTQSKKSTKKNQKGMASWYGPRHHGKRTANGERFNMNALTAAHKTLPMNTMVKVKSLSTGKTVTVRINDRGPYARGRIIDVSKAAAKKLGFINKGTDRVEITVISKQRKLASK